MRSPDSDVFLKHILECIELIESYLLGVSKADFLKNKEKQDSVVRRIEIIGEASKYVSPSLKNKYSEIPWNDIAGMRNKLIHEYFGVDLDITWQVVVYDIKKLKKNIEKILKEI